jgi:predicted PurR-regulated permease PerM
VTELRRTDRWHDGFGRVATRSAQTLLVLAVVVVITYVGVQLRLVVVPVLIAVLVAAAAAPLVDWFARRLPRAAAVWSTLLIGIALLGGVAWLVGDAVAEQWSDLRDGAVEGFEQLQEFIESGPLGLPAVDADELTAQLESVLRGSAVQSGAVTGATAVAQVLTGVVLAVVVLFFLLKDGREIWAFFRAQLPEREHRRFDLVGQRSAGVMGGYVRGTATVAFVDAVLIGVGIAIVGVPLALPLALLVFVTSFVPIVGAVAAGVVATLVALVSNGPLDALIVLAIVIAVNQIEGNLLQPVLMGRYLSLHPLVILLALAAGSIVAGIIGAILAVPFAAVAWAAVQASRESKLDPGRAAEELAGSQLPGTEPPAGAGYPSPAAAEEDQLARVKAEGDRDDASEDSGVASRLRRAFGRGSRTDSD